MLLGTLCYIWMGQDRRKLSSLNLHLFICNWGKYSGTKHLQNNFTLTLIRCTGLLLSSNWIFHGSFVCVWFRVLWLFHLSTFPGFVFSFATRSRAELELRPDLLISFGSNRSKQNNNCHSRTVNSNYGQLRSGSTQMPEWQAQEGGWIPFRVMAAWQLFRKNTTTSP